jgi:predicted branched-subunit amino acid permease
MLWKKLSEPIRKLGEWLLNAGLAAFVALVLPFFENKKELTIKAVITVVITLVVGLILIFVAEIIKEEG